MTLSTFVARVPEHPGELIGINPVEHPPHHLATVRRPATVRSTARAMAEKQDVLLADGSTRERAMRSSGYCSGLRQGGSSSCKEVSMSNIGLAGGVRMPF
jgi:hypothetical protein